MMIELRHLRYFLAVAQERNFTHAARRLNMAQPPLSRQIQQMEEELGAPLFDRKSRPLELTAVGRLFHEHAVQVLDRVERMRGEVRRFIASERPTFTIGFVPSTIYARLPDIIRAFRTAAPDIELSLLEMTSFGQIAALKERRIDIGFGRLHFDDPLLVRQVLRQERLVVALPLGHPLLKGERPIDIRSLGRIPLIVYPREPRPSFADQVLALFRKHEVEPPTIHEVRELQTAIGMVAAEAGACLVPASVQRMGRADVIYRELTEDASSPIIMSYRKEDMSSTLRTMAKVILTLYSDWSWPVPAELRRMGGIEEA